VIEIQHLKKQYEAATPLEDVNVTINRGDVIAVIGPSGTGKSTLLRCINQLETPTSGRILLDGEEITNGKCDINRVRTRLGMVFQSFNLYEHLTVVENCMLAQTVLLGRSRQEAYDRAMELLASVGMDTRALQYPSQLSGGQKQRVAIARTLSTDPEIILFDEPTSALDPLTVGEVEEVIARLAEQGRTMMIVTHSMDFARAVSNRVFYMDQGGIYEDGTPEEIFDKPQKERTRIFLRRLSSLELTVEENTHDLNAEIGKIVSFCRDRKLEANRIMNACQVYEELYSLCCRYLTAMDKTLQVSMEYESTEDKLTLSLTPYSLSERSDAKERARGSLEYKLICHYAKPYRTEHTDVGAGVRYTVEL